MCEPPREQPKQAGKESHGLIAKLFLGFVVAGIILIFVVFPVLLSESMGGWTTKYTSPRPISTSSNSFPDLKGQVAIVTGANTGIGYYTALELARNGATVICAARSSQKGETAVEKIQKEIVMNNRETCDDRVKFLPLDLSSLQSVKQFTKSFKKLKLPLNILVLNAGIMKSPGATFVGRNFSYGFETTVEGFESHIGVNHIGHFYLAKLLSPTLQKSAPSRVVSVSSSAELSAYPSEGLRFSSWKPSDMPNDYEDGLSYGQSKLANILFAREFASRMEGKGVTAYSCHPGVIATEGGRYLRAEITKESEKVGFISGLIQTKILDYFSLCIMRAEDGALTQLHLATADPKELVNGGFYHPIGRLVEPMHEQGSNSTLQKLMWTETERMIKKAGF